jgi:hypothetical protein
MNWRRGLLLAGINLAVALAMIVVMDRRDAQAVRDHDQEAMTAAREGAARPYIPPEFENAETGSEEMTVSFDPCPAVWVHYEAQVVVVQAADPIALTLTGWRVTCPDRWTLAEKLHGKSTWLPPTPAWLAAQRKIDAGLFIIIAIQWFLIGTFPLRASKTWWAEPGAFITACAVPASILACIPAVEGAARLPAMIALFAWFWWFGLLIWKIFRSAWQFARRRPQAVA